MSNERTDGGVDPENAPAERPGWAGPSDGGEGQVPPPPDTGSYTPEPSVLSHLDDERMQPVMAGSIQRTDEEQAEIDERIDAQRAEQAGRRAFAPWVLVAAAATVVVLIAALLLLLGGGDDGDGVSAESGTGSTGGQAAAPTSPPAPTAAPTTPPAPTAFRANAEQLRNANVIATDLAAIYGTCVYEITVNGGTDVEQSVSSSPAMMQAMQTAGYQGVRNSSRAPTPCLGFPFNAASVSGNARDVAAAQALFAAARTNYQALFPGFTPFEVPKGQLDEVYCQHGVFAPAGNIIAVACWMRKGTTVSGVFILLPPNSPQAVIDAAKQRAQAYVTRLDGVLR